LTVVTSNVEGDRLDGKTGALASLNGDASERESIKQKRRRFIIRRKLAKQRALERE